MADRLAPLDGIDGMLDTMYERDVLQIRYGFVRRCASRMCNHWLRTMLPSITRPVMQEVVEPRLRRSLTSIARADASADKCCDRWWHESALPTTMGGVDVGGSDYRAGPAYVASIFAVFRRLRERSPSVALLDLADTGHAIFAEARSEYEHIRAERDRVHAVYVKDFINKPYYTLRGGEYKDKFRPLKLPSALPDASAVYDQQSSKPPPAQRALTMVCHHVRWLECLESAKDADATDPSPFVRNREAVRFISSCQEGAGSPYDMSPDGSFSTKIESADFELIIQRHGGLDIAAGKAACDAQQRAGVTPDRKGDTWAAKADHNRRHNGANNVVYDMISAVAIGQVIKGDKTQAELTAHLNEDHVVDVAEVGGNDLTGGDTLVELKVPSPLVTTYKAGRGTHGPEPAGTVRHVGNEYAFGNTEEFYRIQVLGCKRRGRKGKDKAFCHKTGKGYVKYEKGQYRDALVVKRSRVVPLIVEATGGIAPHSLAYVRYLSRRAQGKGARDATKYGSARTSARDFYSHYVQRLSVAAQRGDVRGLRKKLNGLKQAIAAGHADGSP